MKIIKNLATTLLLFALIENALIAAESFDGGANYRAQGTIAPYYKIDIGETKFSSRVSYSALSQSKRLKNMVDDLELKPYAIIKLPDGLFCLKSLDFLLGIMKMADDKLSKGNNGELLLRNHMDRVISDLIPTPALLRKIIWMLQCLECESMLKAISPEAWKKAYEASSIEYIELDDFLQNKDQITLDDFPKRLRKSTGFGLPHTDDYMLGASSHFQAILDVQEKLKQFRTYNGMGANVNDLSSLNCHGRIQALFYECFYENSGDFILDIGCGAGHYGTYLLPKSQVVFNDVCNEHLALAHFMHHKNPGKGYYLNNKAFPHQVDFLSENFTGIICAYVGHYWSPTELQASFQKMAQLLKPGGCIFYRVLTAESRPFEFYKQAYDEKAANGEIWPGYIEDVTLIKPDGVRDLPQKLHPHGFKEVSYLAKLNGLKILNYCITDQRERCTPPGSCIVVLQKTVK